MFRLILLAACVCLLLVQFTEAGTSQGPLGTSCTSVSECSNSNAECRTASPRICVCADGYVEICSECIPPPPCPQLNQPVHLLMEEKENSQNCTADSDCASNNCNVNGTNTCVAGLGGCCTQNSDCTVMVPNSQCNTTSPRTCECPTNYQLSRNECKKVNGQNCTADSDCLSNNCNDVNGTNTCVAGLGGYCTQNSDCTVMVPNSECNTSTTTCECPANHQLICNECKKVNGQNCTVDSDCVSNNCNDVSGTKTCVAGLGGCCTQNSECTAMFANSQCSTTAPRRCECPTNYQQSCNECKKVNGQTCNADSDCVSNNCNDIDRIKTCVSGLGGCCTQNNECTVMIVNSQCSTGTPRRCECPTNHKLSCNACISAHFDSGATGIAVSLVLLLMAVVTTCFL